MSDDDRVFKALADPTRRLLLDRLFARDGRTLTELESDLEMTRFGVLKHLRVLEDAGLVVTRRSGREKLHFLNPVPIRLIHDRWIDKYTERQVTALTDLKNENWRQTHDRAPRPRPTGHDGAGVPGLHPSHARAGVGGHHQPEWTERYGYGGGVDYDLRPGGQFQALASPELKRFGAPDVIIDGEVLEADPPRKLVQTWRLLMDPAVAAEGFTRLTYEIEPPRGRHHPPDRQPRPRGRPQAGPAHGRPHRGRGRCRRLAVGPQGSRPCWRRAKPWSWGDA